ncbi:hypothetical protein AAG570_005303 [Ranatra chinensis]|uniref:Uncharacterized protein n=1 Tax=Ranatra chinensis TaxID=642074 RepID=A0ABD0YEV7_9HEMI
MASKRQNMFHKNKTQETTEKDDRVTFLEMGSSSEYFLKNVSDSSESDEETKQFTDLEAIIPEARKYKEKPIKMAPIKFWNPLKPGMSVYLPPPLLLPAKKATISTKDQSSSSSSEEESIFALIQRMMLGQEEVRVLNTLIANKPKLEGGDWINEKHRHPIIIYAFGGDHVCRPVARSNLLLYNSLFNVGEKCYINIKFKGTFGLECNGVIEGWIKLEGDSFKIYSYLETKRKKHYKTCDIRRYIFINSEINGQCTTDSIFQPSTLGSLVNRSNEESTPESTDKLLEESEKVDIGFRSSKIYKSRELLGLSHDLNVTNSNADVLPGNISIVEEYSGHTLTEMLFAKVPDLRNLIPQNWDIVRFLIVLWEMDVRDFLELLSVIKSEEHADSKHVEESSLKCEESASGELRKDASQLAQESSAPAETEPNAGSSTVTDSSSFHRMVFERQRSKSAHIKPFYFGGFAEFSFSQLVQQFAKTDRSLLDVTAESSVIKNTLSESEMVEAKWDVAAFAVAVWEMALPEICVLLKILAEDLKSPLDKIYRSKPHHEFKFRDDSWMNPPLPTSGKLSIQERQVRGQWKEKRKEAKLQKKKEKLLKKLEIQKRADPTLPTANLTSSSAFSSFILSRSSSKVVSCWKESSSQDKPPEETLPETWGRRDTRIKCGERVIEDSGTAHEVYPSRSWLLKAGNTQASFSLSSVSLFGNARHSPTDDWMEPDELIYGRRRSSVSSGRIHRDSRVLFEAEAEYWTPDQRKKPLDMNDNVKRTLFCECCDVATGTFEHDTSDDPRSGSFKDTPFPL